MRQVQEAEDEKEEQSTSNLLLDFICYDDRRPSLREWRPESQHFYPYFPLNTLWDVLHASSARLIHRIVET